MKIRHIGIVVNDLPLAIQFYRDLLGLNVINKTKEDSSFIETVCGIKKTHLTTVKLAIPGGGIIELLSFQSTLNANKQINRLGFSHIALTVNNLEIKYQTLLKVGVHFISPPRPSPDKQAMVAFCQDFEGNFIELVEELRPKGNYINTIYDEKIRSHTAYPSQLCKYLFNRFEMKAGRTLLDVGCGRGDFLRAFKDFDLDVYGLDYEKSHSCLLHNIEVRYANIENEPFPFHDRMFDVVFSKSLIEHLFNPENFMKECHRVLKPGGRIIIMTPDWISQRKIFFDDHTHRQPYTVTAIRDILRIFKFKEIISERFYQLPVLWRYPLLKVLSYFLRLFVPVTIKSSVKFIRWSVELMILGTGIKNE